MWLIFFVGGGGVRGSTELKISEITILKFQLIYIYLFSIHLILQEALSLLSSSVKDKCEVYGDYSENVSDTYKMMASIHLSQGNIPKALKTYKKVFIPIYLNNLHITWCSEIGDILQQKF